MSLRIFRWRSLKTKITLLTLAIFLVSVWLLVFFVSQMLRADMQRMLGKQQFSTASFVAADANRELTDGLDSLGRVAGMIDPARMGDILDSRPVLLNSFSGGFVAVDTAGKAVAEYPPTTQGTSRLGKNFLELPTVVAALTEGKSGISQPFRDPLSSAAMFAMAVPLRDGQSNVTGALIGLLDLDKPNFVSQQIERYYGRTGYFLLIDRKVRQVVTSTGRTRNLEELPPPGAQPALDRFIEGIDETSVITDRNGVEILASARRVAVANWCIIAALPAEEAFELITDMQHNMFQGALLLTLLAGSLSWWMMRRELRPMLSAVKTLTTLSDSDQPVQPLPVARHDEVGDLIDGFNHLLEVLAQREYARQESEERFKALHDASFGGIFIHENGVILDCNQGLCDLTGYSTDELIGMNGLLLVLPECWTLVTSKIRTASESTYDAIGIRKNGSTYHVSIRGKSMPYKGRTVRSTEFRDVTEHKEMEELVRQQALHDSLTRLPNRRLFNDRVRQAMAAGKRNACYSALMFLDLDNFKPLNDEHGHEVGDLLLVEVADRLTNCVRETDTVARFGGDEFVVLLSELSESQNESTEQAAAVAEKIRMALARPYRLSIRNDGDTTTVVEHECSASIGVTLFIGQDESEDHILRKADGAMYRAKESGRNRVRFADAVE